VISVADSALLYNLSVPISNGVGCAVATSLKAKPVVEDPVLYRFKLVNVFGLPFYAYPIFFVFLIRK
jgi:hypothetical protein